MTPAVPAPDLFGDADLSEPVARAVRRIALAGFQALWSGRSVTLTELLGEDITELTESAEHLRLRGRIELSADGHLIAVHGLCRRPTPHRIEHHDGVVNTWCALDAIGIPAALEIDAQAVTRCPTCQDQLAVRICGGEPQPLPEAALWYPEVTCGHLVEDFCSGANLFCTLDHLERWAGISGPAGRVISLDEVAEVGREGWADVAELLRADASEPWGEEGLPPSAAGGLGTPVRHGPT
jgi:alkylmercury lyase